MEEAMFTRARLVFKLLALTTGAAAAGSAAQAADSTRYVSITGDNANACTLAAPCRTLQHGINATPVGGELRILDSGVAANNATVSKSITISGNDNTIFLGSAIAIDDTAAVVTLRGLTLNGQGAVDNGISIVAAAAVHIERCVIHNFTLRGIYATAEGARVFVADSISRDNGNAGLHIAAGDMLTIDNSHFDNNATNGVLVLSQSIHATIRRSTASGNGLSGIVGHGFVSVMSTRAAQNGTDGFQVTNGSMMVESSLAAGNDARGLHVVAGSIARIANSTLTDNGVGIRNSGTVETRQNNTVQGNGIDLQGNALTAIGGI
jgi:hypothetical protein